MLCAANPENASVVEKEILNRILSGQYELHGQSIWNNKSRQYQAGHDGRGYHVFSYWDANKQKTKVAKAHRVIWLLRVGDIPDGMQINHIDGIKDNNDIKNLELVTPSGNAFHAYRLGLKTPPNGELARDAKLSDDDVVEMRKRYATEHGGCMPLSAVRSDADIRGLSSRVISLALTGVYYKHLGFALSRNHASTCDMCRFDRSKERWRKRRVVKTIEAFP